MRVNLLKIALVGLLAGNMQQVSAQARLVFNNDAYLVIDNAAQLVIDNPNPNAITFNATGANIVSEAEDDLIRWEIGNATGNFIIPWTNANNVKIPLSVNLTAAGAGGGHFLFSTHTDDDAVNNWNNLDYRPSDVTNMGGSGIPNNSPSVIDRFWRIQQTGYSTEPQAVLTFGYDDAERTNPGNVIPAGSMFAQQFDVGQNAWYLPGSGTDNFPILLVSGADATGPFFRSWTLVTVTVPLPVAGLDFEALAIAAQVRLDWELSETGEDWQEFVVERSGDAIDFEEIGQVVAVNGTSQYRAWDRDPVSGLNHYRLRLVDLNGEFQYSEVRSVWMGGREMRLFPNPLVAGASLSLELRGMAGESVSWRLYDLRGKLVRENRFAVQSDLVLDRLPVENLRAGVYLLDLRGDRGWSMRERVLLW